MITPAQWVEFVRQSKFSPWEKTPRNGDEISPGSNQPGMEVRISDDAVSVGKNFFYMPFNASVTVRGAFLEFDHFNSGGKSGGGHHVVLRVPISSGAESAAARVVEQRQAPFVSARKRFRRKLLVVLAIFLLVAAACMIAFGSKL